MNGNQPGLFDQTSSVPRARKTDPATSHLAAERATKFSGRHAKLILSLIHEHCRDHGLTACELEDLCDLDRYQIQRRLPELRDAGLIAEGRERPCGVKGSLMKTWHLP